MRSKVKDLKISKLLGFSLVGTTIAISPWTNYDPINLPKLLVLSTSAFALLPFLVFETSLFKRYPLLKLLLGVNVIFLLTNIVVMLKNSSPLHQQIWGTFGRANGLVCLASLIFIFWGSVIVGSQGHVEKVFRYLILAGYCVAGYTLVQYMGIDPLPWSQKLPTSFLGNINFMSSFLGLVNIYIFSRIVLERDSLLSRIYFLMFFSLNSCLILASGSIQGLGITAIGVVTTLTFFLKKSGRLLTSGIFLAFMSAVGTIGLFGTAGIGPLRGLLLQETVIYRTDYWRAGWAIFKANIWDGVGIDSLGDYYTEFRDVIAATRTGPGRVVNTSHNVFLDLFANGGVIVGLSFLLFVAIVALFSLKSSISGNSSNSELHLTSLILGWIFFLTISINQIGVTVWGFAFMGLAIGVKCRIPEQMSPGSKLKSSSVMINSNRGLKVSVLLFGLFGLVVSFIPLRADSMFLSAIKSGSPERIQIASNQLGVSQFHKNKSLEAVLKYYGYERAVEVARKLTIDYPRNSYAWNVIATAPSSVTDLERKVALRTLVNLDPKNPELRARLDALS